MKRNLLQTTFAMLMFASILTFTAKVKGQTNPTPFNLSAGSYEFSAWDSLSPAGTFPESMIFHYVAANQTAPFYTDGSFDYSCPYNKTKRPRIIGLMNRGIGLLTTSSSQYNNCSSGTASSRFIGDVVLALNTTGRNSINISWKSETIVPGDGNGKGVDSVRVWKLRLQYRVGESGLFADVPGPIEFISSTTTGDSVQFGPTALPEECNNQSLIQLRWIYFESFDGTGTRPELRLDDIVVSSSDQTVGLIEHPANSEKYLSVFPNPAHEQFKVNTNLTSKGTIKVTNQVGKLVMQGNFSQSSTSFDCSNLPVGIYFVRVTDTANGIFKTNKLVIQ